MNLKRVSGDPMGDGKIIDHHNFLMLIYWSLRQHCSTTFVVKLLMNGIEYDGPGNDNATKERFLVAIVLMYSDYYNELERSPNDQRYMCALFLN